MSDPFNRKQKIADYVSQMRGVAAHKQSQERVSFEYNTGTLIKRSRQSFPQAHVRKPTWAQPMGKAARRSVYVKKPKSFVGPSEPRRLTVKEKIQAVQDEVFPKAKSEPRYRKVVTYEPIQSRPLDASESRAVMVRDNVLKIMKQVQKA